MCLLIDVDFIKCDFFLNLSCCFFDKLILYYVLFSVDIRIPVLLLLLLLHLNASVLL